MFSLPSSEKHPRKSSSGFRIKILRPVTKSHSIHGTGIFTYIYHMLPLNTTNVGKNTIHGSCGNDRLLFKKKHDQTNASNIFHVYT